MSSRNRTLKSGGDELKSVGLAIPSANNTPDYSVNKPKRNLSIAIVTPGASDREDLNGKKGKGQEEGDKKESDNLDSLYPPPVELMYDGPFDMAKKTAEDEDKWLIVNVQSKQEFRSLLLNLDIWAHEAVAQTIGTNFIFWQVYDDVSEGQKVCEYYKVKSFPAVLVLNPITGQNMKSWTGLIEAVQLLEDLSTYMDASPRYY